MFLCKNFSPLPPSYTEALQESHYYPFGMQYERLEEDILHPVFDNQTKNKYLYNGKEFVDDLGLNWNDYGPAC